MRPGLEVRATPPLWAFGDLCITTGAEAEPRSMHRQMGQPSFALLSEKLGQNERLERIGKVVDWGRSADWLRRCIRPERGGRAILR